jgi:5'-nucleotidase
VTEVSAMIADDASRAWILTNDDGLDEPGLGALAAAVAGLGRVQVIAPLGPQSSCSHAVTTRRPIRIEHRGDGRIGIEGTPADCVRLALHHFEPDAAWVLSGINAGGNLGSDIHLSGTVAAVREAALHGVPGIAFSHYLARGRVPDWARAAAWVRQVLGVLQPRPWEPGTFWNVNFPHLEPGAPEPEVIFCPIDPSPLPVRYEIEGDAVIFVGDYHGRPRVPRSDIDVCFSGQIAVSRVRVWSGDEP